MKPIFFLCLIAALAAGSPLFAGGAAEKKTESAGTAGSASAAFDVNSIPSLRQLADAKGVILGAAIMPDQLDNAQVAATLARQYNYITPENHLKWGFVHPGKDKYDFSGGDKIAAFVKANGMAMRGHALAWHQENPAWLLAEKQDRPTMMANLKSHIETVMAHYQGTIRDWDVVNEALDENGGMRHTLWLDSIGPDYIEFALKTARAADPKARLFLNDYMVEFFGVKADAFYNLVKDLKARNIPLDGVGFQFHLDGRSMPNWPVLVKNYKRFVDLGLEIQVTELDVRLPKGGGEKFLAQQAVIYREILKLMIASGASKTFITWGFTDAHSWIPGFYADSDFGLIFDKNLAPKPAFAEIKSVLDGPLPGKEALEAYATQVVDRTFPAFRAIKLASVPTLDAAADAKLWQKAYAIPLSYNQLNQTDFTIHNPGDASGVLYVGYSGNTLYGRFLRTDDNTFVTAKNAYENDCLELFWRFGDKFKQIRTTVGQSWGPELPTEGKAVWSADGKILEFSVPLGKTLEGTTIGFLAAMADNDGDGRKAQLYPVVGNNTGYQGNGYAELSFQLADGSFVDGPVACDPDPFQAPRVKVAPLLDGKADDAAWSQGLTYPFVYDHLSGSRSAGPAFADLHGSWQLVNSGGMLYGLVKRTAVKSIVANADGKGSAVEVIVQAKGKTSRYWIPVGATALAGAPELKLAWAADGSILEFGLPLDNGTDKVFRFSIGLWNSTKADGTPEWALYPFTGYALAEQAGDNNSLGAQMTRKAYETAKVLLP